MGYVRLGTFGGKVGVVVGDSAGGMIGFCLAARHPGPLGHIAIIVTSHAMTEAAKAANLESARLRSAGRKTDAGAVMVTFLYPEIRAPWVTRLLASVAARVSFPAAYDPSDVLVGAEAVNAFDGRKILPTNCTLKLYKGKDHLGTMSDKRLPRDVLEFVRHPRPLRP